VDKRAAVQIQIRRVVGLRRDALPVGSRGRIGTERGEAGPNRAGQPRGVVRQDGPIPAADLSRSVSGTEPFAGTAQF
jgi:hypothetical protein